LQPATPKKRAPWIALALGLALLATIALRFAQPIEDGDIFWQMAYGSQIVDRHTLRTDHTIYSWMPASNDTIYCAWTGELLFLALWKAFGIAGIFAARYAAILVVLGLLAWFARYLGLLGRPEIWLVMLVMLLASIVGTVPKPTMLSFVLWNAMVFCGFRVFLAAEAGQKILPWIYAIPVPMLIWVNTHGLFFLAAPLVVILPICGFWLLPRREAWHLVIAAGLCLIATTINPYGVRYPLQLVDLALGRGPRRTDFAWNNEYQPTTGPGGSFYHLPEFLGWMIVGVVLACLGRRRGWPMVAILFLVYMPLYFLYVRCTVLAPAIFGFGVIYLLRGTAGRPYIGWITCFLFGALAARAAYEAKFKPDSAAWFGFGISYRQPVDETEFLARGSFGPNLYNDYDTGGYLLWRLNPQCRVMVDARAFPYLHWIDELHEFQRTRDPQVFGAFLARHPGPNAAMVDFHEQPLWRSFLNAPGWRPAYYGPCGAVFLRSADENMPLQSADSVRHLRNGNAGFNIFNFARAVGDYATAWNVLDQMQGPLRGQLLAENLKALQPLQDYRDGHAALRAGNYMLAWESFGKSFRGAPISGQDKTIMGILQELVEPHESNPKREAELEAKLQRLQASE